LVFFAPGLKPWSYYYYDMGRLYSVRFSDVAKFTILTPLSFPIVSLKMSSLLTSALKAPYKIFIWYLENLPNTSYNSSQKMPFA
jgi:hypothetical protein